MASYWPMHPNQPTTCSTPASGGGWAGAAGAYLPVPGAAAVIKVSIGANHPQAWWIRSIAEEMPEKCVAEEAPGLGPWVEEASELEVEN